MSFPPALGFGGFINASTFIVIGESGSFLDTISFRISIFGNLIGLHLVYIQ